MWSPGKIILWWHPCMFSAPFVGSTLNVCGIWLLGPDSCPYFLFRSDVEPRGGWYLGVQPLRLSHVRQLAGPRRPRVSLPPSLQSATRSLLQYLLFPLSESARLPTPGRPCRPQLCADQLRQGLGTQVQQAGDHRLPGVVGSAHGSLQVTHIPPTLEQCISRRDNKTSSRKDLNESYFNLLCVKRE